MGAAGDGAADRALDADRTPDADRTLDGVDRGMTTVPALQLEPEATRRLSLQLWQPYLVLAAFLAVLFLAVPPYKGSASVSELLGLAGIVALLVGVRRNRPRAIVAWRCFAVGLALPLAMDAVIQWAPKLLPAATVVRSWTNVGSLTVYPFVAVGLLILVRRSGRILDGPRVIDSLIMTLGGALLLWVFLIAPFLYDKGLTAGAQAMALGRLAGDVVVLAAAIRLAVEGTSGRIVLRLLLVGVGCLLAVDFVHGALVLHGAYDGQPALRSSWLWLAVLFGGAALHPSMRDLEQPNGEREPPFTRVRLTLLTGASMIAPSIEITKGMNRAGLDVRVTIEASVVLFLLVVLRMAWLVRAREQSVNRERTLTAAGAMLVGATSRDQIAAAALDAVHALIDGDLSARLCLPEDGGMVVFGEGQGLLRSVWTLPGRNLLPGLTDGDGVVRLPDAARIRLRMDGLPARVVALELPAVRGTTPGMLIVAGDFRGAVGALSGLRTLVSQVSLALESNARGDEMHRQESEARISSLVQNSSDLITVLDGRAQIVYQSPSIERVLGYSPDEVVGRPFATLLHPSEQGRLLRRLTSGSRSGEGDPIECALQHRDGSVRHFEIVHNNMLEDGAVHGIVLNGRDVSERKAFEEQLARQAFHDPVTHLANRALFTERVRHAVARSLREGIGLAVIFIDLDDFKIVNDSLGHSAGDRVLLEVAQRLEASVRAGDTVARFGSDEFTVLLEDIDGAQAAAETAERILYALAQPMRLERKDVAVRASLGLSVAEPGSPSDADELTRNADAAMYIAKAEGKGSYRLFEPAMHESVLARLELRADLERALEANHFELYFQPIVRLDSGAVTGVEALLRWNHPARGLVPPDQFIPFAEQSGLIVPIGRWALHEGCRALQEIRRQSGAADLYMSVNLSVEQLFGDDMLEEVCDALDRSGLEPEALTLEITESVMMTDVELAVQRLNELKAIGVKLAMDDFGTGYSSISYLTRFPLDTLKMDRSLLNMGAAQITSGLASAVLGLGHTFGVAVVAEGIEHEEQSATLRELGCELGQGYYFGKPMRLRSLIDMLRGAGEADPAHGAAHGAADGSVVSRPATSR